MDNTTAEIATEKKLTVPQRKAVESLLTSGNVSAAAEAAGVNRSTLYKWMADETFIAALHDAEREAIKGLSRTLAGLGELAATALRDALGAHQKPATRLRAAEVVIGNLLRLRELVDIEERLANLEKAQRE